MQVCRDCCRICKDDEATGDVQSYSCCINTSANHAPRLRALYIQTPHASDASISEFQFSHDVGTIPIKYRDIDAISILVFPTHANSVAMN